MLPDQEIDAKAIPRTIARSYGGIDFSAPEIDQLVVERYSNRKIGETQLEPSNPPAQPCPAKGHRRIHRKDIRILITQSCKCICNIGEPVRDCRQQAPANIRELHPAAFTHEKRHADPIFQLTNLIADCRLGQPQLLGRARKILVPARGLEGADSSKRGQPAHSRIYKFNLWHSPVLLLAAGARMEHLESITSQGEYRCWKHRLSGG